MHRKGFFRKGNAAHGQSQIEAQCETSSWIDGLLIEGCNSRSQMRKDKHVLQVLPPFFVLVRLEIPMELFQESSEARAAHRSKLEYDVIKLQMELQDEMELRSIFQNASDNAIGVLGDLPCQLPPSAQKLLVDIATLEFAVSSLEEQMASLEWQISAERLQRQSYEQATLRLHEEPRASCTGEQLELSSLPVKTISMSAEPTSPDNVCQGHREHVFMSSSSSTELPTCRSSSTELPTCGPLDSISDIIISQENSVDKWKSKSVTFCASPIQTSAPNRLSEQMVKCMMDIYRHLCDGTPRTSPDIPEGDSFLASTEVSSFMSFARSPLVDLRVEREVFDPYATEEKLLWPDLGVDLGPYAQAFQVCWILVGKEQLDYAAEALLKFKHLVEQLSRMDPSTMDHVEKLAFWINIYNALMMHAFLAYGIPKTESKYYSLMQKANYTFQGHSFNALTIEVALLKSQRGIHRHQHRPSLFGRIKLSEQQKKFAISHSEPLVPFALSFGAWSCPAVRVYTPDKVQEQLESSLQFYLQATVGVSKRGKLLIPRLLYTHARDTYVASIPEWICERLTSSQRNFAQGCLRQRTSRYLSSPNFAVVPFDSRFRYLFLPVSNAAGAAAA